MKPASKSQYKKMDTEAKTLDPKMETLEDPREIEDVKQQHVLLRQHRQEKIADLQKPIKQKEFADLCITYPTQFHIEKQWNLMQLRNENWQLKKKWRY